MLRRGGVARRLKVMPERVSRLAVLHRRAQLFLERLATGLFLSHAKFVLGHLLLVFKVSIGDDPLQRLQSFLEGRSFHDARPAHHQPPEVWHDRPVIFALWADRDLASEHGRGRRERRYGHEVEGALCALGDVGDPPPERVWQKKQVEARDWWEACRHWAWFR